MNGSHEDSAELSNWMNVLLVLAGHLRLILSVGTIGIAASLAVALLLPPTYTARIVILPPQQTQSSLSSLLGQLGSVAGLAGRELGIKNPADLYAAILQSETIHRSLIKQFDLMNVYDAKFTVDASKKLAGRTDINVRSKEGLIELSVEDRDPRRSAELANAYVEQLSKLNDQLALTEAAQRRLFFEQELRKNKLQLANAEEVLKRTQQATGLLQVDSQAKGMIEAIAGVNAQISAKEIELRGLQTYATDRNALVITEKEQLAALRAEAAKLKNTAGGSGDPLIATSKIPQLSVDYLRALRELKYQEALFEILSKQYEAARIDEAKSAPLVQVVDPAVVPEKKSGPHRSLIVFIGAFVSVAAAALGVLLANAVGQYLTDPRKRSRLALAKALAAGRSELLRK